MPHMPCEERYMSFSLVSKAFYDLSFIFRLLLLTKARKHFFFFIEELSSKERRDSPTAKGRQVPCRNWIDSSANSALKDRDCARAAVQVVFLDSAPLST